MPELSPAAQSVLTAVTQSQYCLDPCDIPNEAAPMASIAAAALRAAADHCESGELALTCLHSIHAIADELETLVVITTSMSELSSSAEAVLNAVTLKRYDVPYYACPNSIDQIKADVAAALDALADQVVPTTTDPRLSTVRSDICRIARELKAQ